jgi:hypothetical protein
VSELLFLNPCLALILGGWGGFRAEQTGGEDFGLEGIDLGLGDLTPEGVGVEDPPGEGFGCPFGEDDEPEERLAEVVEEEFAIDGLRPGIDVVEMQVGGETGTRFRTLWIGHLRSVFRYGIRIRINVIYHIVSGE